MSTKENKDLVTRYAKESNAAKGDVTKSLALFDKYFDPKFVEHVEIGDLNFEQSKQVMTTFLKAFPDINTTIEDIVAEGDKVVARYTMRFTHKGEFLGVAPTGKEVSQTETAIYRIAGRKIAEAWAVHDSLGLMQQLGAIPSPSAPAK
jgi:predicted ester cyclase